jgi:hypothetical protein
VVTKSLASTPFGKKLIYKINGECIWSEYISFAPTPSSHPHWLAFRARAGRMVGELRRGLRCALFLKAS